MRHLNYNHLLYFWTVAEEGTIARASKRLHLTPQTISSQIKLLEESVGNPLFLRQGRRLVLSDVGKLVKQYADEIFPLGAELASRVRNENLSTVSRLNVGIVETLPKTVVEQMLQVALEVEDRVRLNCQEGSIDRLVSELALHRLDLVLSDRKVPDGSNVKLYNHVLGKSQLGVYGPKRLIRKYRTGLPGSLDGAPFLLPSKESPLRRAADAWFELSEVMPEIIVECSDSALIKAFASQRHGLIIAPELVEEEIAQYPGVHRLCSLENQYESFFAVTSSRRVDNPLITRIIDWAKASLSTE